MRGDGGRQQPGALASAWGGGVGVGRRRGVATEAGVEDDDGGAGAGTEEEARPRRTARAGPMGGGGAQGGGMGRRRRGGRSERVADGNRDESRGGRRTAGASLDYRESLRYRVKRTTGT